MKRKIIVALISVCLIGTLVFLAIHFGKKKDEVTESLEAYRFDSDLSTDIQTIKNEYLTLDFDPTTAQFTLTDKAGNKYYSNPQGSDVTYKELNSTVVISYTDKKGVSTILDNFKSSVEKGNYRYEVVDDTTIRADFTIGNIEKVYMIPLAVPAERYDALYEQISDEGKKVLKSVYRVLNYDKLKDKDNGDLEKALELYPDLADHDVVALRDSTQEWKKEELEGYFEEIGYSSEDYEADLEYYGAAKAEDKPAVNISVYYILDGRDLVVKVPFDEIQYYTAYPLTDCRVLPYFCSAGEQEEGFLFVPDGSGAMIDFNNKKNTQTLYSAKVYGWDFGAIRKVILSDPETRFPVYGISYTDREQSMLCMIENGDAYAYIEADVAGRRHNYNYVTGGFTVVHSEHADVSSRSSNGVQLFEEQLGKGEGISIRYRAVDSDSYVDMAKEYREYLFDRYPELKEKVTEKLPVAIEMIGAITKTQQVLGFPKDKPYALTTYKQMQFIVEELEAAGIEDMSVIINGWFNEGVVHEVADDVDLISKLGSKKDFKNMMKFMEDHCKNVYLKADVTFVYKNSLFDSFNARTDAAKYVSREIIKTKDISNIFYSIDDYTDYHYLAKPKYMMDTLNSFLKEIDKLGGKNVAFNSIGNVLAGDYNRKNPVTRQTVMQMHADKLAAMQKAGNNNLIYEGNAYLIPYTDMIVNMPLKSQGANIVDRSIPFFQIALHGTVAYTGDSLNITGDFITNLLKTVETGAGMYCILMNAESKELQDTNSTMYYGANFDSWKDDIVAYYKRFTNELGNTYSQTIDNHELVAENVSLTEYSDGTQVYVNYRTADYTLPNGKVVPAQDWLVVKGGN